MANLEAALRVVGANVFAFVLLAVGAESLLSVAGVRFPAIGRPDEGERGMWRYDATKGWSFAPNTTGHVSIGGGADRAAVRINSIGLRGPEPPAVEPGPAPPRVVVLGDSFVFGLGVDEDHVVTSVLEGLMQPRFPGARVVNMGVSGYSTDQELILFRELAVRYHPSVVVLMMCDNDFSGILADFAYLAYYKPYFTLSHGVLELHNAAVPRLDRMQRSKLWLGRHSILWNAVRSRRSSTTLGQAVVHRFQVATPREPNDHPVGLAAALVLQMRAETERFGGRFLMANTAHRGERLDNFTPLRRRYLRPAGVQFVRMEDHLERARLERPGLRWDFPKNSHWNVESHRLVAEVLYENIVPLLKDVGGGGASPPGRPASVGR